MPGCLWRRASSFLDSDAELANNRTMTLLPMLQTNLARAVNIENQETIRLVVLVVMLVLAFAVMGVVLLVIRRNFFAPGEDIAGEPLSLHDIRELHTSGKITDEEFETMKRLILPAEREVHPEAAALKRKKPDGDSKSV